ncbi:MAG: transglutaminase family protein cysteine peptidase [Microvirga sp.]|jgi:predicted transglutaminase-like cysteine proteinase|nr:transglutaminase family protein cysteine peptidase [Microvirga sp.]
MRHALEGRFDTCVQIRPAGVLSTISAAAKGGLIALTLVLGGATQAQTVASLPGNAQAIDNSGSARPVAAWTDFCRRHPTECAVSTAEPAKVAMTPDIWSAIVSVNRRVNARIKPTTDKAHWNVVDRWDFPDDGQGDCEDYQLLKRKMLRERGLPQRAMRMTVVIDELNEGHAVLMIRSDRGDYILDNKTNAVLPWDQTGYVYVKREGQDSMAWTSLGGVTSPTATANR